MMQLGQSSTPVSSIRLSQVIHFPESLKLIMKKECCNRKRNHWSWIRCKYNGICAIHWIQYFRFNHVDFYSQYRNDSYIGYFREKCRSLLIHFQYGHFQVYFNIGHLRSDSSATFKLFSIFVILGQLSISATFRCF